MRASRERRGPVWARGAPGRGGCGGEAERPGAAQGGSLGAPCGARRATRAGGCRSRGGRGWNPGLGLGLGLPVSAAARWMVEGARRAKTGRGRKTRPRRRRGGSRSLPAPGAEAPSRPSAGAPEGEGRTSRGGPPGALERGVSGTRRSGDAPGTERGRPRLRSDADGPGCGRSFTSGGRRLPWAGAGRRISPVTDADPPSGPAEPTRPRHDPSRRRRGRA